MIDTEHRQLYMFVGAPCCSGGTIIYKSTSLASPSFRPAPDAADPAPDLADGQQPDLDEAAALELHRARRARRRRQHRVLRPRRAGLGPDTRAPDTRIATGAPSGTTATTGRFVFASDEAAVRFECSLDGAAFAACATPATVSGLAPGGHRFAARAIDWAGNVDATPATESWTTLAAPATAPAGTTRAGAAGARRVEPLRLIVLGRQRLGRRGRVRVAVTCRATCRAVVRVRVRGVGTLHAVRRVRAGRTVVVVLRLDRARLRAARRLLARGRAVRAEITVTATDRAGRRLPPVRRVVRLVR